MIKRAEEEDGERTKLAVCPGGYFHPLSLEPQWNRERKTCPDLTPMPTNGFSYP